MKANFHMNTNQLFNPQTRTCSNNLHGIGSPTFKFHPSPQTKSNRFSWKAELDSGGGESTLAVFLISDVFGYEAPNLRKLADKIAAAGFYADKGAEDAKPVIEALKSKGISAIGAVGFCWGAKVVVQLAKREVIQAAVLCHPSFVSVDDIKGVEVPIAVLGAEIDHMSPPSLLKQFEEVITANSEVDGYVKIFPKVEHGWTVRYDVGDEAAVKPAEEAHQNMLEWFAKYVKTLADKIAAAGFYVVVSDFFYGDPYAPEAGKPALTWLEGHGVDKGVEDAKPVIEALKSKGISAIGAVGFCWGAKAVVQLAKRDVIQAAVLCHPSLVTVYDIKGVEVPIAVLGAEIDHLSPPSLLKQFEEVITANNEVDGYVKIFPKVEHGWTVRYNVADEAALKPAEEAHQNMLEWFAKYVK
ncbi:hypothetical protein LWI28_026189 [Acer negundo]|uniref:Dienelactone hydrolase domain-containing protein n=1 Tax=Acer negundo TaxID=4023 RepID=A0AAD5JFC6_ACENE|nr:hypothetical protein LWI28_026189 [Acer negundo]